MAMQIMPRPCLAMKFMASGVQALAAMVRSPSFSRSASSTTMTNRPALNSSTASSTEQNSVFLVSVFIECFSDYRV